MQCQVAITGGRVGYHKCHTLTIVNTLTCSNRDQSCLSPPCRQDDQGLPRACGIHDLDLSSVRQCPHLHTPHMAELGICKQTINTPTLIVIYVRLKFFRLKRISICSMIHELVLITINQHRRKQLHENICFGDQSQTLESTCTTDIESQNEEFS